MVVTLAIIFSVTYYLADRSMKNKNFILNQKADTSQVNSSKNSLDDKVKVSLFAGEKKEKELTIGDLKKQLDIGVSLTQEELVKIFKDKGYSLDIASNGEMMFKKNTFKILAPNKYYIGEKDGFLAIYRTDDKGNPSVESSKDVFGNSKKVDSLKLIDKEKIKNFELQYDSKDEAEESISEFLS